MVTSLSPRSDADRRELHMTPPVQELSAHLPSRPGRESRRSPASLEWEIGLLDHLGRQGMRVPRFVPALDGRRHVGSWAMQSWLDGDLPRPADWPAVAAELSRLHQLTAGWPQRPGFASTRELLSADRGGDVGLLDWDEGRVDYADLDLAELPLTVLPPEHLARAQAAATAWEAANGWLAEPACARQQLVLLLAGRQHSARTANR
jgi:hypothetical protein